MNFQLKLRQLILLFLLINVGLVMCGNIAEAGSSTWSKLSGEKIFFGHQSVGQNILDGISEVSGGNLLIREINANDFSLSNGLNHARVGKNYDPISKIDSFYHYLDNAQTKPDIAFLKLCYVDFTENTNIVDVFEHYKETISKIHDRYPNIKIVHFTSPLKVNKKSWKTSLKKLLGREIWEYADNVKRNQYNALIIDEYSSGGLVFDIAEIEATYPDGTIESFEYNGEKFLALIQDYTYDGGHLNETGRVRVAEALIAFLAQQ